MQPDKLIQLHRRLSMETRTGAAHAAEALRKAVLPGERDGGRVPAMNDVALWRRLLAELLGSAFLTAVVIGSGIASGFTSSVTTVAVVGLPSGSGSIFWPVV